jgi:hypothetical protein
MKQTSLMNFHFPQNKDSTILFFLILLLGLILRLAPGFLAGFPINDGGMFLVMIRDLRSNGLLLPSVTSYNFSDIPFAYPPFGIYVSAMVSGLLTISEIELLRWLPPLVSAAIIPTFYWLVRQIFDSERMAIVTIAIYALLPGSSDWLVMGGGLTRSFGILFSLLAIGYVHRTFRGDGNKSIGFAILFCALTVLSHPEVGLQIVAICLMLWFFDGKNPPGVKNAILIALGTLVLTAPWWFMVLRYHGFSPFASAIHTGIRETLIASLFHSIFSTQGGLPILPTLYLIGIFVVSRRRDFMLVAWVFLPYFVDPRNAPAVALFPIIMLASEGAHYLYIKFIQAYSTTFRSDNDSVVFPSRLAIGSFAILLIYLFLVSWRQTSNLVRISLTEADRETMGWVRDNTPTGSQFLLLTNTGDISPMADSYQEWFPALTERKSQNTLQGLEWTLGAEFFPYSQRLMALQSCQTINCLTDWMRQEGIEADYLVFRKKGASKKLMDSFRVDAGYRVVYDSENALIFLAIP